MKRKKSMKFCKIMKTKIRRFKLMKLSSGNSATTCSPTSCSIQTQQNTNIFNGLKTRMKYWKWQENKTKRRTNWRCYKYWQNIKVTKRQKKGLPFWRWKNYWISLMINTSKHDGILRYIYKINFPSKSINNPSKIHQIWYCFYFYCLSYALVERMRKVRKTELR